MTKPIEFYFDFASPYSYLAHKQIRKIEKEERQSWALNIENKRRASLNLEIFSSYEAMKNYNDAKETDVDKKKYDIDVDDDYLLNEGAQILSDYTAFSQNTLLSKAA